MANIQDSITVEPAIDVSSVNDPGQSVDDWLEDTKAEASYPQDRGFQHTTPFSQSPFSQSPAPGTPNNDGPGPETRATAGRRRKRAPSGPPPEKRQGKKKPTVAMVQQQQQDEQSAVKRIKFTQDMTAKLMVWFNECKAQGLFSSSKRKDYGTAWETVFLKCVEAWPRYPWNKEAIANKYNSERKRFVAWKTLLAYSGVSYDWAAHLPVASEATWQQFFARYNTSSRSILWLRNQPLGDERVYESVFWREMATGEHIFEAGDATQRVLVEFSQRDTQDLSDGPGSSDSGRDNSLMLDSESSEDEVIHSEASQAISQRSSAAPASARRLTPAQQRRRETDPDITPASGSQPAVTVPPSNQRRSRDSTTESEAVVMGRSMREAAAIIAGLPGARDLALAVEDLQAEFVGKISGEEMLFCCEYLRKEPMMAAMWLKLSPEIKRLYVERWKIGPLE